jgi:hypothetical protein
MSLTRVPVTAPKTVRCWQLLNNCLRPSFSRSTTMGSIILQEEPSGEEADSERERQELLALIERQSQEISQLQEQVRVLISQVS